MKLWMDLGGLLADAAEAGAKQLTKQLKPRRRGSFLTRRPGAETPMWNACAALLREELKPYGSRARLARFLGIPKQRLSDFLRNGSRMPDAETLLRVLNWLAQKRAGRDIAL
ncbi:MAG: helix-turn-helix transcriptional regulator [Elusimicrobiota bacterium]